jgi:hypothetical protein
MTREQFPEFKFLAQKLIVKYQSSVYNRELRNLVESQARHLLAEFAPDSPFEKQLDILPTDMVLQSALDFYNPPSES